MTPTDESPVVPIDAASIYDYSGPLPSVSVDETAAEQATASGDAPIVSAVEAEVAARIADAWAKLANDYVVATTPVLDHRAGRACLLAFNWIENSTAPQMSNAVKKVAIALAANAGVCEAIAMRKQMVVQRVMGSILADRSALEDLLRVSELAITDDNLRSGRVLLTSLINIADCAEGTWGQAVYTGGL